MKQERFICSKEKIKIKQIMPPIIAEEYVVRFRTFHREAYRVICAYIDILGAPKSDEKIAGAAWLVIGKRNVILKDIHRLPGKSVAILNVRYDSHSPRQDPGSPEQAAVRDLSFGAGSDLRTNHGKGKVTQVTGFIGLIAVGRLADIGEKELALFSGSDSRSDSIWLLCSVPKLPSTGALQADVISGARVS